MLTRHSGIILYIVIVLMFSGNSYAQDASDWESFTSLFSVNDVAVLDGFIYGGCTNGMFRYDIEEREYTLYYSGHNLDKSSLLTIAAADSVLYLGFERDGLVRFDPETDEFTDILFPEYVNQTDRQKTITLNDIIVYDEQTLIVAHDNGIDLLNIETEEIRTFSKLSARIRQDTPVRRVYVFDEKIWACTTEGLAWADIDDPNLESENAWESVGFGTGVSAIIPRVADGDTVFLVGTTGNGIKQYDPDTRTAEDTSITEGTITDFVQMSDNIYATVKDDTRNKAGYYRLAGNMWFPRYKYTDLNAAVVSDNYIYIAAAYDGLLCITSSGYWTIPAMNLPKAAIVRNIDITDDGVIWTATADRDEAHTFLQKYHDGQWVYYDAAEGDGIPSENTTAVLSSSHGPVWASTWGDGVYVIYDSGTADKEDDLFLEVDQEREIIIEYNEGSHYYVCPELTEDADGNIWIAGLNKGAYVVKGELPLADYQFQNFGVNDGEFAMHVTPDVDGWVWLGMLETGIYGVFVGDDPFDKDDDVVVHLDTSDGILGDSGEAIHPDLNGDVWVGSEGGLNLIEKASDYILDVSDVSALLGEDGIAVQCIEVDPNNIKWIGTTKGLVKVNANNEYVTTYTTENSPILSNVVYSLKYDEANDVLLIGTDAGLSCFTVVKQSAADETSSFHMYPNPFEIWGYDSKAVFTNLKSDKPVRIYTFNGELVTEIEPGNSGSESNSEAVWNGRNFKDEFVSTGVYFFTGVDNNGEDFREKMVVIRR